MKDLQTILVGIDVERRSPEPTPGSRKASVQALWLARQTGARVRFLSSTWSGEDGESFAAANGDPAAHASEALARLEEEFRAQGVQSESVVTSERAGLAITRSVLRSKADLVIVAKRTEEQTSGRRLGTVAIKLLRTCPGPVWVVKPEHDLVHRLVLVATDLTAVGRQATRYGAFVAGAHGCELHLVHAYQVPLQLQMESANLSEEDYSAELERLKSSAQEEMHAHLAGCELEKEPVLHVVRSSPSIAIRESVEHLGPDLLVMGMISRGGIAGLLVGDTAERLLETVDCSMLTVKPDDFICPVEPE